MTEINIIIGVLVLLFSVIIHEVAHGSVAYALGDSTAKDEGRLSLNPISHLDPFGSILIPFMLVITQAPFLFGWAKPVPVNFYNLQDSWGELKVAIAGPISNLLLAVIFCLLVRFSVFPEMASIYTSIAFMNIFLALFNLLPIFPLDGSHILFNLLPDTFSKFKEFMTIYGMFILIFVLFVFPGTDWLGSLTQEIIQLIIG